MVELWVTGISDGWAHFETAASNNTELNLYSGKGWVFAQLLGVDAADRLPAGRPVKIFREPTTDSPKIGEVAQQTTLKLIGCRGEWAQVEYRGLKGWLPPELRERFVIKTPNKKQSRIRASKTKFRSRRLITGFGATDLLPRFSMGNKVSCSPNVIRW